MAQVEQAPLELDDGQRALLWGAYQNWIRRQQETDHTKYITEQDKSGEIGWNSALKNDQESYVNALASVFGGTDAVRQMAEKHIYLKTKNESGQDVVMYLPGGTLQIVGDIETKNKQAVEQAAKAKAAVAQSDYAGADTWKTLALVGIGPVAGPAIGPDGKPLLDARGKPIVLETMEQAVADNTLMKRIQSITQMVDVDGKPSPVSQTAFNEFYKLGEQVVKTTLANNTVNTETAAKNATNRTSELLQNMIASDISGVESGGGDKTWAWMQRAAPPGTALAPPLKTEYGIPNADAAAPPAADAAPKHGRKPAHKQAPDAPAPAAH